MFDGNLNLLSRRLGVVKIAPGTEEKDACPVWLDSEGYVPSFRAALDLVAAERGVSLDFS